MTPWYVPILTTILGALLGFLVRSWHDRRSEQISLRRNVFSEYMKAASVTGTNGLYAMQIAGCLRLDEQAFSDFLTDIKKAGRPVPEEGCCIEELGIRRALEVAAEQKIDLQKSSSLDEWYLARQAEAFDKRRKQRFPQEETPQGE